MSFPAETTQPAAPISPASLGAMPAITVSARGNSHDARIDPAHTESAADAALRREVSTLLSESPYLMGRQIDLVSREGRVTLKGEVETYFQKQMAQEAIRHLEGLVAIDNRLEVTW